MKEYTRPELEIVDFELEDVITVPQGNGNPDDGWY